MADSVPGPALADAVEIYYAPSDVYDRRRNGQFGIPLLIFVAAVTILYFITQGLMQPVMDAEWRMASASMMRKNPQLTPEMLERMRGFQKFAVVGIFFYAVIGPLLAGCVVWIVEKFAGVRQALKGAITVAVFALYPLLVEQLVNAAQMLVLSEDSIVSRYSLSLGPARFLGADAAPLTRALVGHVDVFTIWTAILIAIGVRVTAGASRGQAAAIAAVTWILGAIPSLYSASSV